MSTPQCTNQLARAIAYAQTFVKVRPLVGVGNNASYPNEPAFSSADWVRQVMLAPPFAWRWNRATTTFTLTPGNSDTTVSLPSFSWLEKAVLSNTGTGSITGLPAGTFNVVTISATSTAPGNFTVPHNLGTTPSSGTISMTSPGAIWFQTPPYDGQNIYLTASDTGISAIITLFVIAGTAPSSSIVVKELNVRLCLGQDNETGQPHSISTQGDDGQGNITFRVIPSPDTSYTVTLTYQQSSPIFTTASGLWTPIPDYFSYIYNQGFLAKSYEQASDERSVYATQLFYQFLAMAGEGLTDSQRNIFLAERMVTQAEIQKGAVPRGGLPAGGGQR